MDCGWKVPMRGLCVLVLAIGVLAADPALAEKSRTDKVDRRQWSVGVVDEVRYRLSVDGGGMGHEIDETVLFIRIEPRDYSKPFWVVERRFKEVRPGLHQPVDTRQWIDGRTCPAAVRMLNEVTKLSPLTVVGPDPDYWSPPPSDTPRTRFAGPAVVQDERWAGVEVIRSEYFGPVARWWNLGQKALEGCWRDAPVDTPDGRVRAFLTSPEQVRWMKP